MHDQCPKPGGPRIFTTPSRPAAKTEGPARMLGRNHSSFSSMKIKKKKNVDKVNSAPALLKSTSSFSLRWPIVRAQGRNSAREELTTGVEETPAPPSTVEVTRVDKHVNVRTPAPRVSKKDKHSRSRARKLLVRTRCSSLSVTACRRLTFVQEMCRLCVSFVSFEVASTRKRKIFR